MAGTRFQKPITIGAAVTVLASLAASVFLYVAGQLQVTREVNFIQVGNSTGAVLQVAGVTQHQVFTFPCTNTGGSVQVSNGGAKYDTCISPSPLTTTGAITGVSVECGNVPKVFAYDLSFVKARNTGTGAAVFANLHNRSTSTGSLHSLSTGATLWNSADLLKVGTLTSVPTTSGNDCKVRVELYDKYGT